MKKTQMRIGDIVMLDENIRNEFKRRYLDDGAVYEVCHEYIDHDGDQWIFLAGIIYPEDEDDGTAGMPVHFLTGGFIVLDEKNSFKVNINL